MTMTSQLNTEPSTQELPPEVREAISRALKEAQERIASVNLKEHYGEAVDYLDENFAFFLTHVLNMGTPDWNHMGRTASVHLPRKVSGQDAMMDEFKYSFNPTFAAMLEPHEVAFVAAHETMHILLNHLLLLQNGQKKGKFKDRQKFNIAADCVINDYLVGMGLDPGRIGDFGCFGEKTVGYDCSNATVNQVYADVPDDKTQPQDGEGDGDGGLGDYLAGSQPGSATGDHDWMDKDDQGQSKAAEQIAKDAADNGGTPQDVQDKKQDDADAAKGNPPGYGDGGLRKWVEQKGVSMKWANLLREVDPDFLRKGGPRQKPSYHKMPRKLAGVYQRFPDMGILPVKREPFDPRGEKPSIVMYCDTSGSCISWADKFVTLAKSVPKDIHLVARTFTTTVRELDLENPQFSSGGTAFDIIEKDILKTVVPELGHYPSAVVILTDGAAYFGGTVPEEKNQGRWFWLMTDQMRYDMRDHKFGRVEKIEDFTEGMNK